MNELTALILQHFNNADSSPWFPCLGQQLAKEKWKTLEKQTELNKDNYSTEACLIKKKIADLYPLAHVLQNQIPVFPMPFELALNNEKNNIGSYNANELQALPIQECLDDAFEWLKFENSIIDTIRALVRNIHLLKLEDNEYDVSYSLPNIPFSIFVSIPICFQATAISPAVFLYFLKVLMVNGSICLLALAESDEVSKILACSKSCGFSSRWLLI